MFRAALRNRIATAAPTDFWVSETILLKSEGGAARLIAHNAGELGILKFRQVYDQPLTNAAALQLLASKGYQLKQSGFSHQTEGIVDVYVKVSPGASQPVPPPQGNAQPAAPPRPPRATSSETAPDFWANETILLKLEGDSARLIAYTTGELGILRFRRVYEKQLTGAEALELLAFKGYQLKESAVTNQSEGIVDVYVKTTPDTPEPPPRPIVPDFWDSEHIFLKLEGDAARLIAHNVGELGILKFRQVYDQPLTGQEAIALLASKGYQLKENGFAHPSEGTVDIYVKNAQDGSEPAPRPRPLIPDFWDSERILLKVEGDTARLIAHNVGELGILKFRQVYDQPLTGDEATALLASKGYQLKESAVNSEAEGVVDVYVKVSQG
jgi:hypothetical protein